MLSLKNLNGPAKHAVLFALAALSVIITLIAVGGIIDFATIGQIEPVYTPISAFQDGLKANEYYALYTDDMSSKVMFQYKEDISDEFINEDPTSVKIMDLAVDKWYYTTYVDTESFYDTILDSGTPIVSGAFTSKQQEFVSLSIALIPSLVLILLLILMLDVMMAQMKLGEHKYEVSKSTGVKFSDVIGHDEVIEDIKGYIKVLKSGDKLEEQGITPPKGILFTGAPGTGKTLMAKAMAGEANVPFLYLNTSSVIELFVGQGAKTIRACFKKARELAPSIVFLDEIDAIGNKRGSMHGSSEDTQTLLALLQELDGFSTTKGVLVIAATNCPENLDPALKRSGRFDREVVIGLPRNREVRLELLKHYTSKLNLSKDLDLSVVAAQLSGMSGADIANICNEAATIAMLKSDTSEGVTLEDFSTAIDKLLLKGNKLQNKSLINQKDQEIVAYHEAGHAVMTYLLGEPISRISTQGTTSGVGGFVMQEDKESQFHTATYLRNHIMICYAGRCSEVIKFGENEITTGASNDIQQATDLIYKFIGLYGFSESFAPLDHNALVQAHLIDKNKIYDEMSKMSRLEYDASLKVLKDNYELVEALAQKLLDIETMTGKEVEALLSGITKVNSGDVNSD